jgi:ferrous iron transport protein A
MKIKGYIMLLANLDKNIDAVIIKINSAEELKQRFYSFGLIKGTPIKIEKVSPTNDTIVILVDDTSIALRIDEAKKIEVEILK